MLFAFVIYWNGKIRLEKESRSKEREKEIAVFQVDEVFLVEIEEMGANMVQIKQQDAHVFEIEYTKSIHIIKWSNQIRRTSTDALDQPRQNGLDRTTIPPHHSQLSLAQALTSYWLPAYIY